MSARRIRVGMTTYGYLYRETLEGSLRSIAAAGYRLVEIAPAPPQVVLSEFDSERRGAVRRLLEAAGLSCVSINPPELNLISPNGELRELAARQYRAAIDLASDLGAGIVVVLAGRQSQLIPMPHGVAVETALKQLSELARYGRQRAVKLGVETVPFGFNETAAEVAAMVERLGDDQVGIALDVANVFGKEEVRQAVRAAAPRLLIAHLSDTWRSRWAHTSLGRGEVDFPEYVSALQQAGFGGPCIYELVDGEDPTPRIANDLTTLKGWGLSD